MRTTLSLAYGRVATGADFVGLGEGVHKTRFQHPAIDFEVIDERQTAFDTITDMATGERLSISSFDRQRADAIEQHVRRYAREHAQ